MIYLVKEEEVKEADAFANFQLINGNSHGCGSSSTWERFLGALGEMAFEALYNAKEFKNQNTFGLDYPEIKTEVKTVPYPSYDLAVRKNFLNENPEDTCIVLMARMPTMSERHYLFQAMGWTNISFMREKGTWKNHGHPERPSRLCLSVDELWPMSDYAELLRKWEINWRP